MILGDKFSDPKSISRFIFLEAVFLFSYLVNFKKLDRSSNKQLEIGLHPSITKNGASTIDWHYLNEYRKL
jgi:hypothetical protein